jgi:ferredoxin-NADP reductase
VLISAGSGITPMMAILRHLAANDASRLCTFLHGARTQADIIFPNECRQLALTMPNLQYHVTLSQPSETWTGPSGRLNFETVEALVSPLEPSRYFLCGPGDFMDALRESLIAAGVPPQRIHTEQFHKSPLRAVATTDQS